MIPRALQQLFPTRVRQRGEGYMRQVRLATHAHNILSAVVRGTTEYLVEVDAVEREFAVSCTCPYATDHGVCKHSWAVLRAADEKGWLAPLLAVAGPNASFYGATGDEFDHEFDEDFLSEMEGRLADELPEDLLGPTGKAFKPPARPSPPERAPRPAPPPKPPEWKKLLINSARDRAVWPPRPVATNRPAAWPADRRIAYVLDLSIMTGETAIAIELCGEKLRRDGTWDASKAMRAPMETWLSAPDPVDRQIIQMLHGANDLWGHGAYYAPGQQMRTTFSLATAAFDTVLRLMCSTGRCRVRVIRDEHEIGVSTWDEGGPWQFALRVSSSDDRSHSLSGTLVRGSERLAFVPPLVAHAAGLVLTDGTLARAGFGGAFPLAAALHARGSLPLAAHEVPELLDTLFALPDVPAVDLHAGSAVTESRVAPVPCVSVIPPQHPGPTRAFEFGFVYGTTRIPADAEGAMVFERGALTVHHRDLEAERAAHSQVLRLGAREQRDYVTRRNHWVVNAAKLVPLVSSLARAGWRVDTAGVVHRASTGSRAEVRSGIDWFDLDATVRYGDDEVSLTALLEAERRGDLGVSLPDGSVGLLPTEWLSRWTTVAAGGTSVDGVTRFSRAQTALLDALLEALPEVDVDAAFDTARTELRRFDRVAPADAPATFTGTLRDYQRDGLGWLHFLRQFQLGGCLADDMGLGKTIQVLALLDARRADRAANGPSIVVVPRSLVRNWVREAERFTPSLRVLDHSTPARAAALELDGIDLLITTYGVLRRDAPRLGGIEFDYAILDEAQAIKNASTASAKATRLLRARHRLAVTGTPIENRLEELWSIFEFLNPGMLGGHTGFGRLVKAARTPVAGRAPDSPNGTSNGTSPAALMARALRPVILRRTKQLVAKDLPERSEQTIEVELEAPQRKFYDGILARYRSSVLERVDRLGIGASRMHILEALLRLRQAACHPVLADPRKGALTSAKLDALVPALSQLAAEGHKALVFSQFTSFLALVRTALEAASLPYEYLDGSTRDRQRRVDHFQSDPACPIFLISLKAGGQGLNLTAADYVYLLDPWWNPAVEAQAIDRTHRIGQTRHVIATRLVARGTIEEKILQLQASKRALADAILSEDQGLLAGIGRDELVALLT